MSNPKYVSWLTNGAGCPICRGNEAEGIVPWGHVFSSGDQQPPAHDNCNCGLQSEDPDYDAEQDDAIPGEDDDKNTTIEDGENQPANNPPYKWRYTK